MKNVVMESIKILQNNGLIVEAVDKVAVCRRRVQDHINRVKYFYKLMVKDGIIPEQYVDLNRLTSHDKDKLEPENLRKQALRFSEDGEYSEQDIKDINDVVKRHVKSNKHHCEFWGEGDQNTNGMDCSAMPDTYLYEMMADWAATAEERGSTIESYGSKSINKRWFFSDHQVEIMWKCINYLDKKVDPSQKRDYGLTYIDPAKFRKAVNHDSQNQEQIKERNSRRACKRMQSVSIGNK